MDNFFIFCPLCLAGELAGKTRTVFTSLAIFDTIIEENRVIATGSVTRSSSFKTKGGKNGQRICNEGMFLPG